MSKFRRPEQLDLLPYIAKWLALAGLVALLAGSASALFLLSLDHATQWRETHPWVIWLLPVAGFAVGLAYHLIGKPVDGIRPAKSSTQPCKAKTWCALKFKWAPVLAF